MASQNRTTASDRGKAIVDIPSNAPTSITATDLALGGQVSVAFTAPSTSVGGPITSYRVTSNPGSITATGSTSPVTVTGLTDNTSYTFTVAATNSTGSGPTGTSNSATPTPNPWTLATSFTSRGAVFSTGVGRMSWAGDRFIALSTSTNTGWYSTNGTTWTSFTLPSGLTTSGWKQAAGGNGVWVCINYDGTSTITASATTNFTTFNSVTLNTSGNSQNGNWITFDSSINRFVAQTVFQGASQPYSYATHSGSSTLSWSTASPAATANNIGWGLDSGAGYVVRYSYGDGILQKTTNMSTWTQMSLSTQPLSQVGQSIKSDGTMVAGSNYNVAGNQNPYYFWVNLPSSTATTYWFASTSTYNANVTNWSYMGNGYWGGTETGAAGGDLWIYGNNPSGNSWTLGTIPAGVSGITLAANPTSGKVVLVNNSTFTVYSS